MRAGVLIEGFLVALAGLGLAACGGGGGGGSPAPTPTPVPSATVSGIAAKGLLLDAIVNFYPVTNGIVGSTSLASVRTDAKTGAFSSPISTAGAVVVTVTIDSSTQMLDELSGTAGPAPSGLVLHAVIASLTKLQPIAVTPLTEMVYDLGSAASGGLTSTNINAAETAVDGAFLNSASSLTTQPIALAGFKSAPVAQQELAKLLVALAVAANEGTATGVSGSPCNGSTYAERLVCAIGGLGQLLTLNSSGNGVLTVAANYIAAAYAEISNNDVPINGGQLPSVLGLNVTTPAETALETALAKAAPLPGYDAGASPLANTKAFFADIRTNIVDQSTTQTFGLAPTVSALSSDFKTNVEPALGNTGNALAALKHASDLLSAATANPSVGAGSTANLDGPSSITFDTDGNLYVADYNDNVVLQVSTAGKVSGFAGTPNSSGSSSDGTGAAAQFNGPNGIAADASGSLYVLDYNDYTVRKITNPGAVVTTIAGQSGVQGTADGVGTAATFYYPEYIAIDGSGNLYVTDGIGTIRKLTPSTTASGTVYTVTTIAGQPGVFGSTDGPGSTATFNGPQAITVDATGNVWVSDALYGTKTDPVIYSTIREIVPNSNASAYSVTTIAGQPGSATAGAFINTQALAFDGSGNLWLADATLNVIQELSLGTTPSVKTVAGNASVAGGYVDGTETVALFHAPDGLAFDASGDLYVADYKNNAIRKIDTKGNVTTAAHTLAASRGSTTGAFCDYDPVALATTAQTAECRYGDYANPILMTVTQSAAGTYAVTTQPLTGTPNPAAQNPVLEGYAVSTTLAALDSSLTITNGAGSAQTAVVSGPFYVTAAGGRVTADITVGVSSNWDPSIGTGTLSASGGLSGGSGGISLTSASFGSDSSITVQNFAPLLQHQKAGLASLAATPSIQGNLNVSAVTSAFSYDADFSIGAPTLDKSGKLALPSSVPLSGSVGQVSAGSTSPLFSGAISVSSEGVGAFDVTQPVSPTNFVTVNASVNGNLVLSGGRILTVTAAASGSQSTPTPKTPDSLTATYTYSTPTGTAQVNATATYDATTGFAGTIKNNGGVTATFTYPIGGSLSGTVTDAGTSTATVTGSTIFYSDGTSESLY